MTKKTCKVEGCNARAWQADLCNLHALESLRTTQRRPTAQRLAEGKRRLRERARELGIVLADPGDDGSPPTSTERLDDGARTSAAPDPGGSQAARAPRLAERESVRASRRVTARVKVRSPVG